MSLAIYLGAAGHGLIAGSTYMTLGALPVVIPVHVFCLKCSEKCKLELRLGQSYVAYRQQVPFLPPRWLSRRS